MVNDTAPKHMIVLYVWHFPIFFNNFDILTSKISKLLKAPGKRRMFQTKCLHYLYELYCIGVGLCDKSLKPRTTLPDTSLQKDCSLWSFETWFLLSGELIECLFFNPSGKIPYNRGRKWEIELALRVVAHPPGRVTFSSWRLRSIDIVRTPRLVGHSVEVFVIHVPLDSVSM